MDFDDEALQALIDADPRQTTREWAEQLKSHHSTVKRHLHALGRFINTEVGLHTNRP